MSQFNSTDALTLGRHEKVMREIVVNEGRLKPTSTNDRSMPIIPSSVKLRMFDRSSLMNSIHNPSRKLRCVSRDMCNDRSAPVIQKGLHIKFVERRTFLDTILVGAQTYFGKLRDSFTGIWGTSARKISPDDAKIFSQIMVDIMDNRQSLKHVPSEKICDKSKPFLPSAFALQHTRTRVLEDIKTCSSARLNHVSQINDRSRAFIPAKVALKKFERGPLLKEVESVSIKSLNHVEVINDKSKPQIENINLRKHDRGSLLQEIKASAASM